MSDLGERLTAASDYAVSQRKRVLANLRRVRALVAVEAAQPAGGDALRAAVVFLHATLEDHLRSTEDELLSLVPDTIASKYSLRVSLKQLRELKDHPSEKTLRGLVAAQKRTYNNLDDLTKWMRNFGVAPKVRESVIVAIGEMMERRHLIVHRADSTKLRASQLDEWIDAVREFLIVTTQRIWMSEVEKEFSER